MGKKTYKVGGRSYEYLDFDEILSDTAPAVSPEEPKEEKEERHCSLCRHYWIGNGVMYCTKLQHRIKASRKNGCKDFKKL